MPGKETSEKLITLMFSQVADRVGGSFLAIMPQLVKAVIENTDLQIPKPSEKVWDNWAENLVTSGFVDQDTAELIKGVKDYNFPYNVVAYAVVPLMILMRDMATSLDTYGLDRQYEAQRKTTPHPAPIENLIQAMIVDPSRSNENREQLKRHGFDDAQIDNIILSHYARTPLDIVRTQYLRGIIDKNKLYERMRELGYTDTRTSEIVKTWQLIPPPQDLFAMVAKEAFEPDIYKKLGLDQEFPSEQIEWMKQQGISPAWAQKYWIAHWDQPSIQQGYEMLHRGVIDGATLDLLFRAVEIPSFWRDKLVQIAYSPYTRVDVRRMHDLGVLNDQQLLKAYMDLGYDEDRAENMVKFTLKFNSDEQKQLTRGAILESYRERLISRRSASELLKAQGYSSDLSDYYLTLEDWQREKDSQKTQINIAQDRYMTNLDSEQTAKERLLKLGLEGDTVNLMLEAWRLDRYKYESLPSKTDLDRFLIKGMITEGEYRGYMARHGYPDHVTTLFLEDIKTEIGSGSRSPSRTDFEGWYKLGFITKDEFNDGLTRLGYAQKYIDLYIKELT